MAGLSCAACQANTPPTPAPAPTPGGGTGETITGRERLGWDQPAADIAELATFHYAVYLDGTRSEMADTACGTTAGTAGFACTGRLPPMTPGSHVLELAAFVQSDGIIGGIIESPRSAPLRVTVTGAAPSTDSSALVDGERVVTRDGVTLVAERIAGNFEDVTAIARAPDGRLFVAERDGKVRTVDGDEVVDALVLADVATPGGLLSIAVSPDFARTGHVVLVYTTEAGALRTSRYRSIGMHLAERMVLLADVPGSPDPAAAVRFGPDGKLYVVFDDRGKPDEAAALSEWSGKVLRLNDDGHTPADQPAASPVFWSGLHSPRGLDWSADGTLWIADRGTDLVERLRAVGAGPERPRRAGLRASYVLPAGIGAASVAFHPGGAAPRLGGDLFIAASESGSLLRVRFDQRDATRAIMTERLLDGRLGSARAVQVDAGGTLYVATATTLWRLIPINNP